MTYRNLQYRIYPNKSQARVLHTILGTLCDLYNAALEERKIAYIERHLTLSRFTQSRELSELRKSLPEFSHINSHVCQDTIHRLDKTFQAFFRRLKSGATPGYPRFKSKRRYHTFTFPSYGNGCKIKANKLYIQYVGNISLNLHRPLEGKIKTVTITKKADGWYATFCCEIDLPTPQASPNPPIGIDLGLTNFIATSNGDFIESPKFFRKAQKQLRVAQRKLSRCKKGSNRRKRIVNRVARIHLHIVRQRDCWQHRVANQLIASYGLIAHENLQVKNLVKNHNLAKSIADASWSSFLLKLSYKAESAGVRVLGIDPRNTSQICSGCGIMSEVKKTLEVRMHRCSECGLEIDRDVNAARNILKIGLEKSLWPSEQTLTWDRGPSVVCGAPIGVGPITLVGYAYDQDMQRFFFIEVRPTDETMRGWACPARTRIEGYDKHYVVAYMGPIAEGAD